MGLANGQRSCLAMFLATSGLFWAAAAHATPETDLADRLAAVASTFNGKLAPDDADVRAALYSAAVELDPADSRLLRLKLDAAGRVGDTEGTLSALTALRKLEPQNTSFQARQIDLYLGRLDTADAKLKYLGDIVAAESVPNDVRSFAATRAAWLYWEQSRSRPAWEMIRKALQLNGLNSEAQRLQWVAGSQSATPLQRVQLLQAMLRANPGQTEAAAILAEELAGAGLLKPAADWFDYALTLSRQAGLALPRTLACDYACVLYLSGRNAEAGDWLQQVLRADPTDPASLLLLMAAVETKPPQLIAAVQEGLEQRVKMVRSAAGVETPATQPITSPLSEPAAVAGTQPAATQPTERLSSGELDKDVAAFRDDPRQMRTAYVSSLADLAWFHIYFKNDPAAAQPLVETIRKLVTADDAILARLDGWSFLVQGKLAEAKVKLSAAAGRDPLAELGVIDILKRDVAQQATASSQAKALLEKYPSGVVGVILQKRLADLRQKPDASPAAEAIRDVVDRFPPQLRRLATVPQEFYSVRAVASQVEHEFGQPITLSVTIRNTSDQPLTMGEQGIIRDVWFDVQLRGGLDRFLPGAAYAPLGGPLVLAPRSSYTQVVRLDVGTLASLFESVPSTPLQMNVGVVVNAVPGEAGIAPGVYGYRTRLDQLLVRSALPLWTETQVQGALSILEGGDAARRLRVIDAVAAHLALTPETSPQTLTPALRDAWNLLLDKGTRDASPLVQAWALYRKASLSGGAGGSLEQLSTSTSPVSRLLAAVATRSAQGSLRELTLRRLAEDPNAGVRQVAQAVAAMPQAALPATSSATAPSAPLLRQLELQNNFIQNRDR